VHDGLGDHPPQSLHSRGEPAGNAPAVERKIGSTGRTTHEGGG
jgi:hypothetical protein